MFGHQFNHAWKTKQDHTLLLSLHRHLISEFLQQIILSESKCLNVWLSSSSLVGYLLESVNRLYQLWLSRLMLLMHLKSQHAHHDYKNIIINSCCWKCIFSRFLNCTYSVPRTNTKNQWTASAHSQCSSVCNLHKFICLCCTPPLLFKNQFKTARQTPRCNGWSVSSFQNTRSPLYSAQASQHL